MKDAHDLGGRQGFGRIDRSQRENFAAEWERRAFALTLACGMLGRWNLDQSRSAREQMAPAEYLASSYYEHWLHGLELLLQQTDLCNDASAQAVRANAVAKILQKGAPTELPQTSPPRFHIGDKVRVKPRAKTRHTRAPSYARDRCGVIVAHHGAHVFPDRHAQDGVREAVHLYNVRFAAKHLWRDVKRDDMVHIDLFENYLRDAA